MISSSQRCQFFVAAPVFCVALGGGGCGLVPHGCSTEARPAVVVEVVDSTSGGPLCNTSVVAREGAFSSVLQEFPASFSPPCVHMGPYERAGTYTVDVSFGVRSKSVSGLRVERGDCDHVVTQHLTVALDP